MCDIVFVEGDLDALKHAVQAFNENPEIQMIMVLVGAHTQFPYDSFDVFIRENDKPLIGGIFPYIIFEKNLVCDGALLIPITINGQWGVIQSLSQAKDIEQQLQKQLPWQSITSGTLFSFVDCVSSGTQCLIDELFNQYGVEINYIGGGCGVLSDLKRPCVITPQGLLSDAAVLLMTDYRSGIGVSHGWQSISGALKVTESEANEIISIDWRPAAEVYRSIVEDHSGMRFSQTPFKDVARAYPFGVAKLAEELIIRDPFELKGSRIVCFGDVRQGSYVHIMHGKADFISAAAAKASQRALKSLGNHEPKLMFLMDCMSRALFLGELFAREITHIEIEGLPIVGALTLGEIANNGYDYLEFYNKTSVVGLISCDTTRSD